MLQEQTDIIGCFDGEKVYHEIHLGGFLELVLRVGNEGRKEAHRGFNSADGAVFRHCCALSMFCVQFYVNL